MEGLRMLMINRKFRLERMRDCWKEGESDGGGGGEEYNVILYIDSEKRKKWG